MNAPPVPLSSKDVSKAHEEIRAAEPAPVRTRDRMVQRVVAARRGFSQAPASPAAKTP
jgi:hypothetical protein